MPHPNVKTFFKPKEGATVPGSHAKTVQKTGGASVTTYFKNVPESAKVDNPQIGRARMRLKLAAIAFQRSHAFYKSEDPSAPGLIRVALKMLSDAALGYVESLHGKALSVSSSALEQTPEIQGLQAAAFAYEASRYGQDANPSFSTAGIALLCQVSIRYAESLGATITASDDALQLDDGGA